MWYSNKGAYPVDTLPHRIILSDGSSRTDSSTFTNAELVNAGITTTTSPPTYDSNTHKLSWNGSDWQIDELNSGELKEKNIVKWEEVREERNKILSDCDKLVLKYQSEVRLGITTTTDTITKLDIYMQALREIPQNNSDPFNINWPDIGN